MKNETKHVNPLPKGSHHSKLGEAGTNLKPGMSHEADIALAEGKSTGYGEKHTVRDAKASTGANRAARAQWEKLENNGAKGTGCC